ncbi:MAG TPA: cytochrome c maturation protein CcmE [Gammaproteobacteria bacterium]|nr:cytochrome c maturation protein CcmE [Gammaproteobacteria bacterium]
MTPQRKRRLIGVLLIVGGVGVAVALGAGAFRKNLLFFFSPTQIANGAAPLNHAFRIGGLVVPGSIRHAKRGSTVRFELTDNRHTVWVTYTGVLPDLFRAGQGIVAQGQLGGNGVFRASQVLAKHDSKYMPPSVAAELKKSQEAKEANKAEHAKLVTGKEVQEVRAGESGYGAKQ